MVAYPPLPIKKGGAWGRSDAGHIFVTAPVRAPPAARDRGVRMFPYDLADGAPNRLEPRPARHRRASFPGDPIVSRLIPRIEGIIFRMPRHQFRLPAQISPNLGIALIRQRPQPVRAQPLAAQSHALLRRPGFCLFRGRGHGKNVTCYGLKFSPFGANPQLSTFSAAMKASCGMSTLPNCRIFFLPSFCFSRSLRLRVMSPP